jgi:hypothetical protein
MTMQLTATFRKGLARTSAIHAPVTRYWRWLAIGMIAVLGMLAVARVISYWNGSPYFDFQIFWNRTNELRAGSNLYECSLNWQAEKRTFWMSEAVEPCGPYLYPPVFAIALMPLTFLPFDAVKSIWFLASVASVMVASFLILQPFTRRMSVNVALLLTAIGAAILILRPISSGLKLGQTDPIILLFLAISCWSFARKRMTASAIWLAAALLIKPIFWPLVLLFILRKEIRATLLILGIGFVGASLSAIVVGIGPIKDLVSTTMYFTTPAVAASPQNESVFALVVRLFHPNSFTTPVLVAPELATAVRVLMPLVAAGLLVLMVRVSGADNRATRELQFALALCLSLLATPFLEHTHAVYLVLPLLVAVVAAGSDPLSARGVVLAGAVLLTSAFLAMPRLEAVALAFYRFREAPLSLGDTLLTGVYLYALLATTAIVLVAVVTQRRRREKSPAAPAV